MCRPFGKSYLWPHWCYWPRSIFEMKPETDPVTGQVVGMAESRQVDIDEGMTFPVLAPWQVFVAPHGESLNEKPWIIIHLRVHKDELIPRLDHGVYTMIRDGQPITWEDLGRETGGRDGQDAATNLRRDAGGEAADFAEDVGTLLIYIQNPDKEHPAGREIHVWNYQVLLYDEDRSDWNMPLFVKPVVDLNHIIHIGPDKYHGIGLWSIIRDRVLISEEAASIFIDHVLRTTTGTLMYNSSLLKESQILPVIGGRIPVPNGEFDRAVRAIDWGPPPDKLLTVSDRMERSMDDTDGINDFISGAPLDRKELATTVNVQSQASQVRVEHNASYIERTTLMKMGMMIPKIIDRHMTEYQKSQILGHTRAQQLASVDPDAIPGGYRIRFTGSDRVKNKEQRFARIQQAMNMLGKSMGPVGMSIFAKQIMKWTDGIPAEDIDRVIAEMLAPTQQQQQPPPAETMQAAGQTMGPVPENAQNTALLQSFAAQGA